MLLNHSVKRFFSDFFLSWSSLLHFQMVRTFLCVSFTFLFRDFSYTIQKIWSYTRETQFLVFVIARLKKKHGFGKKKCFPLLFPFVSLEACFFISSRKKIFRFFPNTSTEIQSTSQKLHMILLKIENRKEITFSHVCTFSMEIAQCEFDCDSIIT